MGRPSILQNLIIAIVIFIFISMLIFYLFDDILVRALFMLLAFAALTRVLYQIFRPLDAEVEELKEPEGLDKTVPKKDRKGASGKTLKGARDRSALKKGKEPK
jgi:hypothetical protein